MIKCFVIEPTGEMTPFVDGVSSPIYRRLDTGETMRRRDVPVGAMWFGNEKYKDDYPLGPDGRTLFVKTPGGDWCIDSRANNCTMPGDDVHRCWVRHGEAPNITVDKNGHTCNAGAGSIIVGNYHGFLQNGFLTESI